MARRKSRYVDPLTGRSITEFTAFELAAKYENDERYFQSAARRAHGYFRSSRKATTKMKWYEENERLRDLMEVYSRAVDELTLQLSEGGLPPEPDVLEWELGVQYKAKPRSGSGDRRPSNVDVNVRIRRTDGKPLTRAEALSAIDYMVRGGVNRATHELVSINWRRPSAEERRGRISGVRSWRGGGPDYSAIEGLRGPLEDALDNNLQDILDNTNGFRLGAVKEDDEI